MARLAPLAVLATVVALLAAPARAGGPTMMLGVADDGVRAPDLVGATTRMNLLRLAGFDTVRVRSTWQPGSIAPSAEEQAVLANVEAAAKVSGVRVIIQVTHPDPAGTPVTDQSRLELSQYAAALAQALPSVGDLIVGNEPNWSTSWAPQFNPDRTTASPAAYLALLAATYDAVKAVAPTVRIWGGALAPRGTDRPGGARETVSAVRFLRDIGTAYRASGRAAPVMDGLAMHPYADSSTQSPDTQHPSNTTIALADYGKLVSTLATAFDGTAQPGTALPVLYDEFGVESIVPRRGGSLYTGAEPAGTRPVSERLQGAYTAKAMELAFCQPNVVGLLLPRLRDDQDRAGSQAAILYPDGSTKQSAFLVRDALRRVRAGSIARCDGLELTVAVTDITVPTADDVKAGTPALGFACSLDCTWQVRPLRDGVPLLSLRGYALAGRSTSVPVPARLFRSGTITFELTTASAVNAGAPTVTVTPAAGQR